MTQSTSLGSVEIGRIYPIAIAKELLGLKAWAWRKALQRRLRVKSIGRRRYVTGDELLRFINESESRTCV